jgi:hypothetical protein
MRHAHGTDLAPAGNLILLDPGQMRENGAVDDAGFAYRTLYVTRRPGRRRAIFLHGTHEEGNAMDRCDSLNALWRGRRERPALRVLQRLRQVAEGLID